MTSQAPQTDPTGAQTADPAPGATAPGPRSTHRPGNWRSLVISMIVMSAFVFAFVALQPHPMARERTTVDVARGATQLAQETGWPVATARLGDDWHPTSMHLAPDEKGVQTWRVGYHQRPDDAHYVEIVQTKEGGALTPDAFKAWLGRQTRNAPADGASQVTGRSWERRSAVIEGDAQRVRRSLVAAGAAAPGALATVVTGEVDYATLEKVAESLQPATAQSSSATATSPSSAPPAESSSTSAS